MSYPLPEAGSLEIGRSETARIRIDDPNASRRHATLHVDDGVFIEDHQSINGTFVRGTQIAPDERVEVRTGDAIQIGSTLLAVQQRPVPLATVRVWPHVHFEGRVEDECHRAKASALPFCILRVAVAEFVAADAMAQMLQPVLTWKDALAPYGPGEWEILLAMRPEDQLEDLIEEVVKSLEAVCPTSEAVIARYPDDGRNVDSLLSVVQERLHRGQSPRLDSDVVLLDPAMRTLYDLATRAAQSNISLLLLGETGVGKDILARSIHLKSKREAKPYLSINCAALTESLLESELFGHEKGAFTGAVTAKVGLLESAQGGTVFLDEVGELSATTQAKLLRVLENREITRVGSVQTKAIDVRFIAATNRDLEGETRRGNFRSDLYFRLAGMAFSVPPLRERQVEILPLATKFLADAARRMERPTPSLSTQASQMLTLYSWPGNIRELRNVMERALVLCPGAEVQTIHLPFEKMHTHIGGKEPHSSSTNNAVEAVARERQREGDDEKARIIDALAEAAGNQSRAARKLGMPRRTFLRRLEHYDIVRPKRP